MKRKDHANFCSEIDLLSLSLSLFLQIKEQAMEIARVQAIKSMQERERELPFFSITCFHILPFLFIVSLLLNILSLSLSLFPLCCKGKGDTYRGRESRREETLLTDQRFHLLLFH
jgi:hypothetical protein